MTLVYIIFFIFFGILIYFLGKFSEKINRQAEINLQQAKDIEEIKKILFVGKELQNHLTERVEKTRELIEELKRETVAMKERERDFSERIKRIDEIIAGTSTKGLSGEEILRETFKKLPPEMIETNFTIRGKVVEFALVLPNGKKIPIDSKWPAGNLLLNLEKSTDPEEKKRIMNEIDKIVIQRIKEVKQYIDPTITWSQAIAAVPDSVYNVCREAHLRAREESVILMPYSMVLPLLLYMYRLHLQYAMSVDVENFQNHLLAIAKNLEEMESILENKIYRGVTMISNAYFEYRQLMEKIKSSISQLKGKEQLKKLK